MASSRSTTTFHRFQCLDLHANQREYSHRTDSYSFNSYYRLLTFNISIKHFGPKVLYHILSTSYTCANWFTTLLQTLEVRVSTTMESSASQTNEIKSPVSDSGTLNNSVGSLHPFAHSTAKLELIPATTGGDGIDVEAEALLYDELCRTYEDETDDVGPHQWRNRTDAH